jgi:hypothetical protein
MKLITEAQTEQLLANGRAAREAARADREIDPKPIVKLFTPDAYAAWLLTEIDPIDSDCAYGLCDPGHGRPEIADVQGQLLSGQRSAPAVRDCRIAITLAEHEFTGRAGVNPSLGPARKTSVFFAPRPVNSRPALRLMSLNVSRSPPKLTLTPEVPFHAKPSWRHRRRGAKLRLTQSERHHANHRHHTRIYDGRKA